MIETMTGGRSVPVFGVGVRGLGFAPEYDDAEDADRDLAGAIEKRLDGRHEVRRDQHIGLARDDPHDVDDLPDRELRGESSTSG